MPTMGNSSSRKCQVHFHEQLVLQTSRLKPFEYWQLILLADYTKLITYNQCVGLPQISIYGWGVYFSLLSSQTTNLSYVNIWVLWKLWI